MQTLNLAQVRDSFSQLADNVHDLGEGIVVAKYGRPFVMIVPYREEAAPSPSVHPLRGMPYRMADDFDAPMPALALAVAESGPDFGASADQR